MKIMTDIHICILLFGLTTVLGMYLSSLAIREKQTPKGVIIFHGLLSIAGFTILSFAWPLSCKSILLFTVATMSGLVLLYQDITGKRFTKWLCYVHAVLTLAGMVFLIRLAE